MAQRRRRAAVTVLIGAIVAASCGDGGVLVADEPATTTPPPPSAFSTAPPSCDPPAPTTAPSCVVVVPDPRSGDLRTDPEADTLPAGYVPPAPSGVLPDLAYGPDPAHRLDLHLPAEPNAPVILFLHSGGWIGGTRTGVPPMVLRFVELGYAVASADYRLAPDHPFPSPIEDVKRAIRWLKASAEAAPHVDGDRVVVFGTSAGGHLAALAGTTRGRFEPPDLTAEMAAVDSSVVGIVSAAGPTDLASFYVHPHAWTVGLTEALLGCSPCSDEELAAASVATYLEADLPPAYWAYGADDCLVDPYTQGTALASLWATHAAVDHSWLDLIEGCDHNVDETFVNQRWLEAFVALAVREPPGS